MGDDDPTVPYSQAVRLNKALNEVGVLNKFVTISGGGHGGFAREDNIKVYAAIKEFLRQYGDHQVSLP
jgi:dipeptidyl aminopeptidase/acylaminoacyl peptidase